MLARGEGTLVWIPASLPARVSLSWADTDGRRTRLPIEPQAFTRAVLSPDGRQVVVVVARRPSGSDLWIYPVDRIEGIALATGGVNEDPAWSRDDRWIYYAPDRRGSFDIWRQRSDLSGEPEPVYQAVGDQSPMQISPDGSWLGFVKMSPTNRDLYRLSLEEPAAEPEPLVVTAADEGGPALSPDGRFLAYESDELGRWQLSVLELATGRKPTYYTPSSTRSVSCHSKCRPSCCACCRPASSSGSAPPGPCAPTCASSPPPTATWRARCARAASARASSTA